MPEPTVTVLSTLDDRQQPILNECTLHTGWGAIVFKAGRASDVPVSVARALLRSRADVEVPELSGQLAQHAHDAEDEAPSLAEGEIIDEPRREPPGKPAVDPEEARERAKAAVEHLRNERLDVPPELLAAAGEQPPPPPGETEPEQTPTPEATGNGEATGDGEGEETPAHAKAIPAGFEPLLATGELRCLAAKADGTQCHNAAAGSTSACGLAPHKAKVAELPDAG